MTNDRAMIARGARALGAGDDSPKKRRLGAVGLLASMATAIAVAGCNSKSDQKAYDPVSLAMASGDTPLYDDGETTIYQSQRPISLPVLQPTQADLAQLGGTMTPPYDRAPWVTNGDVKVQITWTISNLDKDPHNVEILIDPWNEFARYVPGVNVGEESTVPNLSGIDLLTRVDGVSRKTGTFTFDDMDELAIDLATVENIIASNPAPVVMSPAAVPATSDNGPNVNGLVNHTFEIHNRSSSPDKLIGSYIPKTIAGLVGFDLGIRMSGKGNVAIEILVEMLDIAGDRVDPDAALKTDGTMWITPEQELSPPMGNVR